LQAPQKKNKTEGSNLENEGARGWVLFSLHPTIRDLPVQIGTRRLEKWGGAPADWRTVPTGIYGHRVVFKKEERIALFVSERTIH
jgi:hypothetical protein